MSQQVMVFKVHRLTQDGYSVPSGSHGIIEDEMYGGTHAWVRWLPPQSGGSGPILMGDLEETNTPLVIPLHWVTDVPFTGWPDAEVKQRAER